MKNSLNTLIALAIAALTAACGGGSGVTSSSGSTTAGTSTASSSQSSSTSSSSQPTSPSSGSQTSGSSSTTTTGSNNNTSTTGSTTAPVTVVASNGAMDGRWSCTDDRGTLGTALINISGTSVIEPGQTTGLNIVYGTGITAGPDTVPITSGGRTYQLKVIRQVSNANTASFYSPGINNPAGGGIEFALQSNGSLKISDYTSYDVNNGNQLTPLTCWRS